MNKTLKTFKVFFRLKWEELRNFLKDDQYYLFFIILFILFWLIIILLFILTDYVIFKIMPRILKKEDKRKRSKKQVIAK